jgi:dTDP-glucose pyrophosphorylase
MVAAGADKICFIISPGKSDILEYYGGIAYSAHVCYVVQPQPTGLCDAIFRAFPVIHPSETVMVGLPDTIWFPENGFCALPPDGLSFLLFPVGQPALFDAVITDAQENILEIQVKNPDARSNWIWGAFSMPGTILHQLHDLWRQRDRSDEYFGTLVNAYIEQGGAARAVKAGHSYVDIGTLHGYHEAMQLLSKAKLI